MTTTPDLAEEVTINTPCPSWCTVDHSDMPPGQGFHASAIHLVEKAGPLTFRLWQTDTERAAQVVVIGGQTLTSDQAHELGMALVRAADVLRREVRA